MSNIIHTFPIFPGLPVRRMLTEWGAIRLIRLEFRAAAIQFSGAGMATEWRKPGSIENPGPVRGASMLELR